MTMDKDVMKYRVILHTVKTKKNTPSILSASTQFKIHYIMVEQCHNFIGILIFLFFSNYGISIQSNLVGSSFKRRFLDIRNSSKIGRFNS